MVDGAAQEGQIHIVEAPVVHRIVTLDVHNNEVHPLTSLKALQ